MRPILSATNTYNYQLAKWLEDKLKPLSTNEYTVSDAFRCAEEIRSLSVKEEDLLVSYDVSALFTNVPLKETINIIVDKALTDDWFNRTYNLNLQRQDLMKLLEVSTSNQLFQFNGQLYEQTDGVAMGSPLGPLMANVFMCHLEEQLTTNLADNFPTLYMRYVDNTLVSMPDVPSAQHFLETLNNLHANLNFSLGLKLSKMGQFWKREFTGNLPTLVCYYITKVMQMYVTKNPLSKQCCTVQNLCHLQMNISNRNAVNCVQYSLILVTHSASSTASSKTLIVFHLQEARTVPQQTRLCVSTFLSKTRNPPVLLGSN